MNEIVYPSELLHIWKLEPCMAGDTLSGGERVNALKRAGLIEYVEEAGYVTTSKGKRVVQLLIEHLDKLQVSLVVDISIFTPSNLK